MKLLLERKWYSKNSTIGELYINHIFFCYTLEPRTRLDGKKVSGTTAIPSGIYTVIMKFSPKFKQELPSLVAVPRFRNILMHIGNWAKDTGGCILVGKSKGNDAIYNSGITLENLRERITMVERAGQNVTIEIKDNLGPYKNI